MKLCKDCKHFKPHPYSNVCTKYVYTKVDLVDGTKTERGETYCSAERSRTLSLFERAVNFMSKEGFQDYCGPKGKYYEAVC